MVPAWKRLGLQLKNADQSGDTVAGQEDLRSLEQSAASPGNGNRRSGEGVHQTVESPQNGKSSRLGKRKLQDGPAEEGDNIVKKSKRNEKQEFANGDAADQLSAISGTGNISPAVPDPAPSSIKARPKGDPNYRKKKGPRSKSSLLSSPRRLEEEYHVDDRAARKKHALARSPSPSDTFANEQQPALIASTETDFATPPPLTNINSQSLIGKARGSALSSSPSKGDRRKSVTFTPDTKTTDGDSASALFKKWAAEQQEQENLGFTPAEVAQFVPPPKVHPANGIPAAQNLTAKHEAGASGIEKKRKKTQAISSNIDPNLEEQSAVTKAKGKKKDPSIYLTYLLDYHTNRSNWKFNKAKQNDVLDNALNVFRIPEQYSEALTEYIKGLKGAAAITRLTERCKVTIEEIDKEEEIVESNMNDIEAREIAKEEALQERIARQKKRRQTDADIQALVDHPYPEGYIRRLKRRRADALLLALNLAAPAPAPAIKGTLMTEEKSSLVNGITKKPVRKRKLRTEASSDESSSDSSSSEDTSSGEDSNSDSEGSDSEVGQESGASENGSGEDSGTSEDEGDNDCSDEGSSTDSGSGSNDESEDESSDSE